MTKNKWINHSEISGSRINLFCFPHAGGSSAFYAGWINKFPADIQVIPVQYPMRDSRIAEPMPDSIKELAHQMAAESRELFTGRFALLGHCSGAIIAYEVALALRELYQTEPVCLYASAAVSPRKTDLVSTKEYGHQEFMEHYHIDQGVFHNDAALQNFFLPIMRKDFELCEDYSYRETAPLKCRIHLICGDRDPEIASETDLDDWKEFTVSGAFEKTVFPGDHFFIERNDDEICMLIHREMTERFGSEHEI